MAYTSIVGDLQTVLDQLNGSIVLGPYPESGLDVATLTLQFGAPNATVTFTGTPGVLLTISQIADQIKTQLNVVGVAFVNRRFVTNAGNVVSATNAGGRADPMVCIVIYSDTVNLSPGGTADSAFGLVNEITATAVDPATIRGFSQGSTPGHYAVLIEG